MQPGYLRTVLPVGTRRQLQRQATGLVAGFNRSRPAKGGHQPKSRLAKASTPTTDTSQLPDYFLAVSSFTAESTSSAWPFGFTLS
jgi:hypothetical protein